MSTYAVVDSGTTTSRVRMWRRNGVAWSGTRAAGARDTAIDGDPRKIRDALEDLLRTMEREAGAQPDAIICSGMITSNMGLHEVPHLQAPAGPDDLARGVVQATFRDISPQPLSFIPGIKTVPSAYTLANLDDADVLRGEEVEITGLRKRLGIEHAATFLHVGSHHKAIYTDQTGRILGSRTALTGELLASVIEHTILKSSLASLEGLTLDADAVRSGATAVERFGFGRALFLVRVGEQLARLPPPTMTSYLVGSLAALTLPLLPREDQGTPVILYGRGAFPEALEILIGEGGQRNVQRIEPATSDLAAVEGAVAIYERSRSLPSSS